MEKIFNIKNNQIACTVDGDPKNHPIFMIHDLASSREVWRQTISTLKTKYYCIAPDLLGFGASAKPKESDYNLSSQAQRIMSLADQLGCQSFSIIGHSMGGQISIFISAVLAPQRVERLVTINGIITGKLSGKFEKTVSPVIRIAYKLPWLYNLGKYLINFRPYANYTFRNWFYDMNSYQFEAWEADRRAAYNPSCAISNYKSLKSIHSFDLTQQLRKVNARTLIIAGKQDEIVPLDQALLAQTLIPNNDLALIEKCGHFPMYEKKGNYLKALALIL